MLVPKGTRPGNKEPLIMGIRWRQQEIPFVEYQVVNADRPSIRQGMKTVRPILECNESLEEYGS